ncbi:solute carrier family 28 member 3 isoform X2 [Eublepharis macularius]|uniref:Sodium/nucleoside cotransporter n=1 Tax=Eublepharis macularius TaxID=481883 RepID=A0AA97L744_EUBMA|nr:solute carrier family 28 member 3 isoform X2 [Eublepharis macularius]
MTLKEVNSVFSDGYRNPAFEDNIKEDDITNKKLRNRNLDKSDLTPPNQYDTNIIIASDHHMNPESGKNERTGCKGYLEKRYDAIINFYRKHKTRIRYMIYGILIAAYLAMVIAACTLNFHRAMALFVLTILGIFFICWDFLMDRYEDRITEFFSPCGRLLKAHWFWLKWVVWIAVGTGLVCWLIFDTAKQGTNQLISFGGLVMYVFLMLVFSKHPTKTFLEYTDAGAKFVFGEKYTDHFFAFKVLPIVVFFSTVMSMLYHIGFMQWLIKKVGWIMQITLGTTPVESLVAAGNIFVGQTESPLLVKPYLPHVTKSELHAIMTAGFSTIAGSVLGAYISFGVSASHLLTASVMSAPAALAISKLFWPETERPQITAQRGTKMEKGDSKNLLEAASQGASASIPLVANIAANLIAFLALLSFFNAALSWLGNMFDYPQLSFEIICSYVFMPFSFMMGVDWEDSFIVGGLLGYKTFFNEFVAYERLAEFIQHRKEGGEMYRNGIKQYMSIRSETIATYALCGFANFGSLGLVIGGLTSMAPSRKRDIAGSAFRAMIAGTVACFMTACIAGILSVAIDPCYDVLGSSFNTTTNSTEKVTCCLNLFNSVRVHSHTEIFLKGNHTLKSLAGCCKLLDPPTFNCSWTSSF